MSATWDCDRFHETAPDLALGLLSGDERGAALNHLAACPDCRRYLESLVQVADELLLLAPSVEPEIGFESRVMTRLTDEGAFAAPAPWTSSPPAGGRWAPARRRWARPLPVGIAAALIVIACVTGLVAGLARGHTDGRNSALRQGAQGVQRLDARTVVVWADDGRSTCQLVAFAHAGTQPARLVIHLNEPGEQHSSYQVMAEPIDGHAAVLVGTIEVTNGEGTLTAAIPNGTGPVDAVRVMEGTSTKYWAKFAPV
jgi:anti-sigma factor RsiW